MTMLQQSGDYRTTAYWELGQDDESDDCVNWIARWFLYHKFRYRDGRKRGRNNREVDSKLSGSSITQQRQVAVCSPNLEVRGYHYDDFNDGESGRLSQKSGCFGLKAMIWCAFLKTCH